MCIRDRAEEEPGGLNEDLIAARGRLRDHVLPGGQVRTGLEHRGSGLGGPRQLEDRAIGSGLRAPRDDARGVLHGGAAPALLRIGSGVFFGQGVGSLAARVRFVKATAYPGPPTASAQQALTAAAASGGRFSLGIGLSHKMVIEDMFGLSYDKPARHMREYLSVLGPLLRGAPADFAGEDYRVKLGLDVPGAKPVPLIVAALGPLMLKIAGELADLSLIHISEPTRPY